MRFHRVIFLIFLTILSLFGVEYQIKYQPVTGKCRLFIDHHYIAHYTPKKERGKSCLFGIALPSKECRLVHRKNSQPKALKGSFMMTIQNPRKVALMVYACESTP